MPQIIRVTLTMDTRIRGSHLERQAKSAANHLPKRLAQKP
jgi:hypothetical protein